MSDTIDPAQAQQPPFPGTQVPQPARMPAARVPPTIVVEPAPEYHSAIGAFLGVVTIIFFVILMIVAISDGSSDDSPQDQPTEQTETPAEGE